jgi:hypothetical protein
VNDLVDDDGINGFLFPVLLTLKVVIGHDLCTMGESHVVCKSGGYNGWTMEVSGHVHCDAIDEAILVVFEHEH